MPSLSEIIAALYGALRLGRFDPRGLSYFVATVEGFWRSFFAAILVAPIFSVTVLVQFADAEITAPRMAFGVVEVLAYVVSWLAYPVVIEWLTRQLKCRDRFLAYMTAYNWSAVVQHVIIGTIILLAGTEALPSSLGQIVWITGTIYLLAYVWFIARIALAVRPLAASAIVAVDLLLSFLIGSIAAAIENALVQLPVTQ